MTFWNRIAPRAALRQLREDETPRVTSVELFFDLVYVFTIIQLSHFLLEHQSWLGALEAATLFAAVWWAWNYTAWSANWINPDHWGGRFLMIFLMACALLMAAAMPTAYSDRAGLFAGAYVTMALVRAGYMALAFRGQPMGRNYAQLAAWSGLSALFWIAGAILPEQRVVLWIFAVLIDYAAPYVGFWLPGAGATPMSSWPLKGLHLLERNQLIFIIALGESVLLLGAMLVKADMTPEVVVASAIGFLLIVSLWWIYFVHTTEKGEHIFETAEEHTSLARAGLAYAHGIMVCGAIVVAVAIEEIVAHPADPSHTPTVLFATLGPILFLAGSGLFYRAMALSVPMAYVVAAFGLIGFGALVQFLHLPALVLGLGVLAVLMAVAIVRYRERETA